MYYVQETVTAMKVDRDIRVVLMKKKEFVSNYCRSQAMRCRHRQEVSTEAHQWCRGGVVADDRLRGVVVGKEARALLSIFDGGPPGRLSSKALMLLHQNV